jgi:fructose-specific component phosphotransferase system IIB-like protein
VHKTITYLKYQLDQAIEDEKEVTGNTEPDGALAWVEDGILRITIDECLPRERTFVGEMKQVWIRKICKALRNIDIFFNRAICIITVYAPSDRDWDVDNRAYKVIPDAIELAGKIQKDTYHNLTLMVAGDVDKDNPRTEIYVIENPFEGHFFPAEIVDFLKSHSVEEKCSGII